MWPHQVVFLSQKIDRGSKELNINCLRRGPASSKRLFSSSSFSDVTALHSKDTPPKQVAGASIELSSTGSETASSDSAASSGALGKVAAPTRATSSRTSTVAATHQEPYHEVLRAVTLEAEQILLNCQLLRRVSNASTQEERSMQMTTLDDVMRSLLETSRRPYLLKALKALATFPSGQSCRLLLHQTFVTVLSAAVDAAAATHATETMNEEDSPVWWRPILQLTRQAQRLHLPLHVPYHRKLAMTVVASARHHCDGSKHTDAIVAALLQIADWCVHIQTDELPDVQSLVALDSVQARKLRFLVPSLKFLLDRRHYGIVLNVVKDLVEGKTDLNAYRVIDLDLDVVVDLFVVLRQLRQEFPSDAKEIQSIVSLLEPSALQFMRKNETLLDDHPQVRNFLFRIFDDNDDDEEDEMDQDVVWDPYLIDTILKGKDTVSGEERLKSVSTFYAQVTEAMDAKKIQIAWIPVPYPRNRSTNGPDASDCRSGDEEDFTSYSSEDEEDDLVSDALALRRHQLYLRGRGRSMDANHFPDVTLQLIKLNGGRNLRFTDAYEDFIWKRDYEDYNDDILSMMALDDSDGNDSLSDDTDDDDDDVY